jgi:hypothetical protein
MSAELHPTRQLPRYVPAVYRDLLLEFYSANYFHQRGYGWDRPVVSRGSGY